MWYLELHAPYFALAFSFHLFIPALIVLLGFLLILISSITFYKYRTTLNPLKPELASKLVKTGLYRYSRNPIYIGLTLILLGWGTYLNNLASMLGVFLFVLYLDRFQIVPEEKFLAQKFGVEFEKYQQKVGRWI